MFVTKAQYFKLEVRKNCSAHISKYLYRIRYLDSDIIKVTRLNVG